jgi:hypothetical protein
MSTRYILRLPTATFELWIVKIANRCRIELYSFDKIEELDAEDLGRLRQWIRSTCEGHHW